MSQREEASKTKSHYFNDAENAAEMARLITQGRLVTEAMGGPLAEHPHPQTLHDVLDLGCGPGEWVLSLAQGYPHLHATGMDMSQIMVAYAQSQATKLGIHNTQFRVMDLLSPLQFADRSFDLVNARMIGFLPQTSWPTLLQECVRISRPGGILRLTECEWGFTNSSALEYLHELFTQAFRHAGQSFSPQGHFIGTLHMLGRFLRDAGCQNIQQVAHALDYSAGAPAHQDFVQDFLIAFRLLQPFLLSTAIATLEEIEQAYQQMQQEMSRQDFCGLMILVTAWGQVPLEEKPATPEL
jgi:ubiquinone/menaquinone biosynthesis C-methylase UbiE